MSAPKHWLLVGWYSHEFIAATSRGIDPVMVITNVDIEFSVHDAFLE